MAQAPKKLLMTALTASLGLVPLLVSPELPGREILYPVAVVIFSGLFASILLDLTLPPLVFWMFGKNLWHNYTRKQSYKRR